MKILIPISGRSDEGLVAPIIKRLRAAGDTVADWSTDFDVYPWGHFDVVLICGDRNEMVYPAFTAFKKHIPIVHLYAGVSNNLATFDDINRHVITLWSDVQFCESGMAREHVIRLLNTIGKPPHAYITGITHLDDLEVDETPCPHEPYDLILYNPPTLNTDMELELRNIQTILHTSPCKFAIFIEPNQDEGRERIKSVLYHQYKIEFENYLRPQFLGLLKNCNKFITNSSVEIYEAPYFLKPSQIIHIGERNRLRDKGPFATGASDKIVKILHELYGEKKKEITSAVQ